MNFRKTVACIVLAGLGVLGLLVPAAGAAPGAAWQVTLRSQQTNLRPGQLSKTLAPLYLLTAENVGAATTSGPITISIELPDGISLATGKDPSAGDQHHTTGAGSSCAAVDQTMSCTNTNPIDPGEWVQMVVPVDVANLPDPTVLERPRHDLGRLRRLGHDADLDRGIRYAPRIRLPLGP